MNAPAAANPTRERSAMMNHLRSNALLFLFTVGIACVLYPVLLWVFARVFFPHQAAGSLLTDQDGGKEVARGSSLIGQNFSKDEYFQPRPSATSPSYNATASGGSNWGASNPKLRDRVARQLGPIVKYHQDGLKKNDSVQKDIEAWFADNYRPTSNQPPLPVQWAIDYPTLAAAWLKADANRTAVLDWLDRHPQILADWKTAKLAELNQVDGNAPIAEPDPSDEKTIPWDDLPIAFFASVSADKDFDRHWLEPGDFDTRVKDADGKPARGKRFKPVSEGADLQATFFELWLQAHPQPDLLQKVPADMVMASGSGLDPHITLRNARYQLPRVVKARAETTNLAPEMILPKVEAILTKHTFTPLSGLIGEPLVNVVEVNLDLDRALANSARH